VREPVRGFFTHKNKLAGEQPVVREFPLWTLFKQFYAILQVSCIRWCLTGVFFRIWAGATVVSFSLLYTNMYNKPDLFAVIYAAIGLFGGIFANMFYAVICDRYESKFIRIKSLVASGQCLGSALCFVAIFYPFISFGFMVFFFSLNFFLFEGTNPPVISMLTMTAPQGT